MGSKVSPSMQTKNAGDTVGIHYDSHSDKIKLSSLEVFGRHTKLK